jgi:hypothetical protein
MLHKLHKMEIKPHNDSKQKLNRNGKKFNNFQICQGKGFFFKKLQNSVLNNLFLIDNISEISKQTIKGFEDKAVSPQNNQSDDALNYSFINFPIEADNSLFIRPGEGASDRNATLFLEFDMTSVGLNKDHLKNFVEINNDFVEKDFHLVLNVKI